MTTRRLPPLNSVAAGHRPQNLAFDPPQSTLDRWSPGLRAAAAADGDNVISIYDYIGSDGWSEGYTAKRTAAALRAIGPRDVVVNVNSPGGDVFEGIAIYNLLREHPHQVTVRVIGLAASAASIIAMAGDQIEMARASFMMIHNAWTIAMGDRHYMHDVGDWLEPFDDALAGVYEARTGTGKTEIVAMMDKETWLSAGQAIDMGFADAYLAADQVEETEPETATALAIRRVEASLAKAGMPRSERRRLLGEIRSTPRAAPDVTPCADEQQALEDLARTIEASRRFR